MPRSLLRGAVSPHMRYSLLKRHSTKAERVFSEILKRHRIPFRFREVVEGHEVDFLLAGSICVEIDGHPQAGAKSDRLIRAGYRLIHFRNRFVIYAPAECEAQFLHQW